MSVPTGMSPSTGMHYQNIAAQMQQYVNNPHSSSHHSHGQLHSAFGGVHQFQPTHGVAYASRAATRFGVDPVITNDVGGFARSFMRNLLH
ncbi:hypothetical protein I4U23_007452 [Adineta vaga]|nr:hypothetical protein I4U23_007452 [Adineta vaga]